MYKVLLVDDEITNYQMFEKLVNWEEKRFYIAGTAADGLEALQKYDEIKPDLIFMDIRLPLMDGLECIRHIREENKKVRIVIVSAYGDFSYAQKAIQYNVQDFLLKPVSRLILNQLVDKMKDGLDAESLLPDRSGRKELCEACLEHIVHGEEDVEREEEYLSGMNLCGVFVADQEGRPVSGSQRRNLLEQLLRKSVLAEYEPCECSPDSGYSVIVWRKGKPEEAFVGQMQEAVEEAGYISQVYLCGDGFPTVRAWSRKLSDIENYGFYSRKSGKYKLEEDPFSNEDIPSDHLEQLAAQAVVDGSCGQLLASFDRIFRQASERKINPRIVKDTLLDGLVRIKFALKKFDQQDSFYLMRNIRMEQIHDMQYADQLKLFIEEKVRRTFDEISGNCSTPGKNLVFRANAFTEMSYQDAGFSVQKVADYIGISKNYFTSQYKELTGIGFWEYVTKLRMEKAKELLVTTDEMIGTIAGMVGYESEFHFSRKYKEYTGQSPKNYRKSVKNSKPQE